MKIADWRAERRVATKLEVETHFGESMEGVYEGPGILYPGEGIIEGPLEDKEGKYCLTIANESWLGDLETLEALLYAWQVWEGITNVES